MSKPSLKQKNSRPTSSKNSDYVERRDKKKIPTVQRTPHGSIEESHEEAAP